MIFEQLSTVFSDQVIFILLFIFLAGAIVGLLSGLFGIGGGIVSVPTLFYFFGFINIEEEIRMHMAVGTSLSIIIPTAITSILGHKKRKSIDLKLLKKNNIRHTCWGHNGRNFCIESCKLNSFANLYNSYISFIDY